MLAGEPSAAFGRAPCGKLLAGCWGATVASWLLGLSRLMNGSRRVYTPSTVAKSALAALFSIFLPLGLMMFSNTLCLLLVDFGFDHMRDVTIGIPHHLPVILLLPRHCRRESRDVADDLVHHSEPTIVSLLYWLTLR